MKTRILISLLFVCSAAVPASAGKLKFIPVKMQGCPPCLQFAKDCTDPRPGYLLYRLSTQFDLQPAVDAVRDPGFANKYNIRTVPTFLLLDDGGNEVGRVTGYTSPRALDAQLAAILRNLEASPAPPAGPSQTKPREPSDVASPDYRELLEANRNLLKEMEGLKDALSLSEAEVASLRKRVDAMSEQSRTAEVPAEVRERLDSLEKSLAAKIKVIEDLRKADQAEVDVVGDTIWEEAEQAPADLPVGPPKPDEPSKVGIFRSLFRAGVNVAVGAGLTAAQSEVLVPILGLVAGGTPIGAGVLLAVKMVGALRKRNKTVAPRSGGPVESRNSPPPTGCVPVERTVIVDGPPTPARETVHTQFVTVEANSYQKAHEQARQQVVRKYPGAQEVLEAELHLTKQYLAGQVS